jgi:DNA-binding LacI/PurR family transcriptional regulator
MVPKRPDHSVAGRTKRVTLQDIADVAGVKKMVVSNALNGTRSVAPATRERVQQIALDMNYIPNFAARALTTGRTGIIAVISGPLSEPYYANAVDFLEQRIRENGFNLMLMRTPDEVKEMMNATRNIAVDGAIAIDMLSIVKEFRSHPTIPCVSISTSERSFVDNVIIDLSAGVHQALGIMLKAKRQRISYLVTALSMARESEVRARAYVASMRSANRVPEIINVATDAAHAVERKFKVYIQENGCPDALLCQNDETAMCAFRTLNDLGYKIPEDVLLVGCDGQRHMRYFNPPLSTIVQPIEEMCDTAWKFLQRRLANPELPHQEAILHGKLIVRKSLVSPSK